MKEIGDESANKGYPQLPGAKLASEGIGTGLSPSGPFKKEYGLWREEGRERV